MFIYCFDKETQAYLTRCGLIQLNPEAPAPYIFHYQSMLDLEALTELQGRYVVTHELIYT